MKRIIVIICVLFSINTYAQHTPLKHIEVPDFPTNKVNTEERFNFSETVNTYTAHCLFLNQQVLHEKGIKYPDIGYDLWSIAMMLDNDEISTIKSMADMSKGIGDLLVGVTPLTVSIGESKYTIKSWYLSSRQLMMDLNKDIIEHISISGLQSISVRTKSCLQYNDIQQELWRRCAKEVYDKRKNLQ